VRSKAAQLADEALELCAGEGFSLAGVVPVAPSARGAEFRAWLDAGKHAEMSWLADLLEDRLKPERLLPGARSAVLVADFYASRPQPAETPEPGVGRIARYCRGRDYHEVVKQRLHRVCDELRARHPGAKTRAFCDTAPIQERELAAAAGLGWIGKHTLLIHPAHGSWMVLGGFLTTLEMQPPETQRPEPDHCGTCTRCIDACPTGAISPYSVDAGRCISYLTIEHESPIRTELAAKLGGWFVGCDVCQEVCPHNSARVGGAGTSVREDYTPRRRGFDLLEVLGWDEPTRRGRFATSAMKRVTLEQVKRNALALLEHARPAGTHGGDTQRLARAIDDLAWDARQPASVREQARRLASGLGGG
jgi:epoxyqueuosine reductase